MIRKLVMNPRDVLFLLCEVYVFIRVTRVIIRVTRVIIRVTWTWLAVEVDEGYCV